MSAVTASPLKIAARDRRAASGEGVNLPSHHVPFAWRTPEWWGWLALVAMGLVGGFGHYLLIRAYENAQPATLAPFSYV